MTTISTIRWAAITLLGLSAAPILCGCDDSDLPPPTRRSEPVRRPRAMYRPELAAHVEIPELTSKPVPDYLGGASSADGQDPFKDPFEDPSFGKTDKSDMLTSTGPGIYPGHSYWLKGNVLHAHVNVLVNGTYVGGFSGHLDKDLTRQLHKGMNSITLSSVPESSGDPSADLELIESEHDPPIPPLVRYRFLPAIATPSNGNVNDNRDQGDAPQTTVFTAK